MPLGFFGYGPGLDQNQHPELLDPRQFYLDRAAQEEATARGVELFAYRVFGRDVIASLAFALDPFRAFHYDDTKIAPVSRSQSTLYGGFPIIATRQGWGRTESRTTFIPALAVTNSSYGPSVTFNGTQDGANWILNDTTRKTRPMNVDEGELELFKYDLNCPSRSSWIESYTKRFYTNGFGWSAIGHNFNADGGETSRCGYLTKAQIESLKSGEQTRGSQLIQKYAPGMLNDLLPSGRSFSGFRELVELRDFPRTLRESVYFVKEAVKNISFRHLPRSRTLSRAFLNKEFGWDTLLSSVFSLVDKPNKAARRFNYLLQRRGKATSFRRVQTLTEPISGPPNFANVPLFGETLDASKTSAQRDVELRMVVNYTVEFPEVLVPAARRNFMLQQLGVFPTPQDVYNLIPWTWLIDWFGGLSDYVGAIQRMDEAVNLINYGFITYESHGNVSTTFHSHRTSTCITQVDYVVVENRTQRNDYSYEASIDYVYQVRKNLANVMSVSTPDNPVHLDSWRAAILAALLLRK